MSVEFRTEREDMLDTPAYSASELVEACRRIDGLRQRSRGIDHWWW